MISTYKEDIKNNAPIIQFMDIADFYEHGWPDKGVYAYTSPTWDIIETVNAALEVMNKNKVINALVMIPTNYRIVHKDEILKEL